MVLENARCVAPSCQLSPQQKVTVCFHTSFTPECMYLRVSWYAMKGQPLHFHEPTELKCRSCRCDSCPASQRENLSWVNLNPCFTLLSAPVFQEFDGYLDQRVAIIIHRAVAFFTATSYPNHRGNFNWFDSPRATNVLCVRIQFVTVTDNKLDSHAKYINNQLYVL